MAGPAPDVAFCNERKINQGGGVRWRNLGRPTQRAVLLAERHRRCSGQIQIPCPPPTVSNAKRPKKQTGPIASCCVAFRSGVHNKRSPSSVCPLLGLGLLWTFQFRLGCVYVHRGRKKRNRVCIRKGRGRKSGLFVVAVFFATKLRAHFYE